MSAGPPLDDAGVAKRQFASTTVVMSLAAVGAALIAMFGEADAFTPLTVVASLLGLIPWALVAGGVEIQPAVFAAIGLLPPLVVVIVDRNPGGMFPVMVVIVAVARSAASRVVVAAAVVVSLAGLVTLAVLEGTTHETGLVYFSGGVGISWLAGEMLRRQERLTAQLVDLHAREVEHAATEERNRIAREIHDVVAHSLTVVMLHVTGARRLLRTDVERADEALGRAEQVGRESLDSIRGIVGLLRSDDGSSGTAGPLPGIGDVDDLVGEYRSSGIAVDVTVDIDPAVVDPSTGLAVYRIVQESLTNAARHAPGAPCSVRIENVEPSVLEVEVVNDPPSVAPAASTCSGHGVRGLTERVRAVGGQLSSGRTDAGGWRVVATLPLRRGVTQPDSAESDESQPAHAQTEHSWVPTTPAT